MVNRKSPCLNELLQSKGEDHLRFYLHLLNHSHFCEEQKSGIEIVKLCKFDAPLFNFYTTQKYNFTFKFKTILVILNYISRNSSR